MENDEFDNEVRRMNKKEWQARYDFSDSDIRLITELVEMFDGVVVGIKEEA